MKEEGRNDVYPWECPSCKLLRLQLYYWAQYRWPCLQKLTIRIIRFDINKLNRKLIIVVIMRMGRIPGHCGIHSLKYLGHFSNIRYTLTQPGQKHWKVFLEIQLPLPFKVQRIAELLHTFYICIILWERYLFGHLNTEIRDVCKAKRKFVEKK